MFSKCEKANVLWDNVKTWIQNKLPINFNITDSMKILGHLTYDKNFWPLNLILLVTRKYLYWCSSNDFKVNIYYLQKEMKIFIEHIYYLQKEMKIFIEHKCLNEIKYKKRVYQKVGCVAKYVYRKTFKNISKTILHKRQHLAFLCACIY